MTYGNDPGNPGGYPPPGGNYPPGGGYPPPPPGGNYPPGGGYPPPPPGGNYPPGGGYPPPPPGGGYGYGPPGGYAVPQYAHWGLRFGAWFIDSVIVGIPSGILYFIGVSMLASSFEVDPETGTVTTTGGSGAGLLFYGLGALVALAITLWLRYLEGTTGQTLGKRAVGIKTIKEETGEFLGFGMAFARALLHIVDALPGCIPIGYLWPIWDEKKQTFADKIVSSIVVRA
ncbi:RDD family protein [Planotetraspora kaengkrachanensis]|uniref:RDD domain-containing protein n=1 Tax=Planotetraspora kaengkrachanensis TaxID=575193 RepID=A0A8J3M0U2_9ACTN|nr:RDD family protein [Planotetraspora kaengkrachanensis]GIG76975.1 hypothetical protein Pka01_01020 [Planotetraspora kaengkrachanensis]